MKAAVSVYSVLMTSGGIGSNPITPQLYETVLTREYSLMDRAPDVKHGVYSLAVASCNNTFVSVFLLQTRRSSTTAATSDCYLSMLHFSD